MRIGIVAGEASGDILGADLIRSLRTLLDTQESPAQAIRFEGVGGPRMQAEGFQSLVPMERLSVMGLVEPLKRLPELLGIRKMLKQHFLENRPDVFIGIDSPDFTLNIEAFLKSNGIASVHYVSPSVWAWRKGRIHKIKHCVDLMLTLFPFETQIYKDHDIPVQFVGHPLADQIPMVLNSEAAKQRLGVSGEDLLIALMPGSRNGEIRMLADLFLATAERCLHLLGDACFLLPAANEAIYQDLQQRLSAYPKLARRLKLVQGQSHDVMNASDVILMASGTTALEALLMKKPMVVAYRMAPISHAIISRLVDVPYVSLPNLLADEALVPELIQERANVDTLSTALIEQIRNRRQRKQLLLRFNDIHSQLQQNAGLTAAGAILSLVEAKGA